MSLSTFCKNSSKRPSKKKVGFTNSHFCSKEKKKELSWQKDRRKKQREVRRAQRKRRGTLLISKSDEERTTLDITMTGIQKIRPWLN